MLLTVLAADAIWESGKEVLKLKGAEFLDKFGDKLFSRAEEGSLPPNHNLDHALRHSLAKTTRVLAWTIHDPNLSPLSKLIADVKLASFADRLAEMVQNNIIEKEPADYWLSALIKESKKVDNFEDFSLELLLKDNQLTSLVHERLDKYLQDHIQNEFLAWSNRHIRDGIKPPCFDDYVLNGWPLPGSSGRKISFYEVFCLFFREELKNNEVVFRAFTTSTIAELKTDVAKMLAAAPSAEERARMEEAFRKLGDFTSFKKFLDSQDEKLFSFLHAEFDKVHGRFDSVDKKLDQLLEAIRPQIIRPVDEPDEKLPDDIKAIIKEAGKILTEGRYIEARQKLESAKQLAEKQKCAAALMKIRIDVVLLFRVHFELRSADSFPLSAISHFGHGGGAGIDNMGLFLESHRHKPLENRRSLTGSGEKAIDRGENVTADGQKSSARGDYPTGRWNLAVGRWEKATDRSRLATGRCHPATGRCNKLTDGRHFQTGRRDFPSGRLNPATVNLNLARSNLNPVITVWQLPARCRLASRKFSRRGQCVRAMADGGWRRKPARRKCKATAILPVHRQSRQLPKGSGFPKARGQCRKRAGNCLWRASRKFLPPSLQRAGAKRRGSFPARSLSVQKNS
jgi:hypothetical protein